MLTTLLLCLLISAPVRSIRHSHKAGEEGVPTWYVLVRAVDYEGEPLEGALVVAYNITINMTTGEVLREAICEDRTNSTGWAELEIPNGTTCDIEVYWQDDRALVGFTRNLTVLSNLTLAQPIRCWVCDLVVRASYGDGSPMVSGEARLEGCFVDKNGNKRTFTSSSEFNLTGLASIEDVLMNCSYVIEGYRPGLDEPFDTVELSRLNGTTTVELSCPYLTVIVSVVDEEMRPVKGALVEAYDWGTGKLMDRARSNDMGLATLTTFFGLCELRAYRGGELLAQTKVRVVENETWCILPCRFYNLTLKVLVLDARGKPIPGLEVRLVEGGRTVASARTGPDGMAIFEDLGKGWFKILVLMDGEVLAEETVWLVEDTEVQVEVGDLILVAGSSLHLAEFLTALLTSLTALLTALTAFLWPRLKGGGGESPEEEEKP